MARDSRVDRYLADMDKAATDPSIKPELPIVFRKHFIRSECSGTGRGYWEVTAFFPTLAAESSNWYAITCYAHIGQHSAADTGFFQAGKKVKPEEYSELLDEIRDRYESDEDFPVTLKVYQRAASWMRDAREKDWRRGKG